MAGGAFNAEMRRRMVDGEPNAAVATADRAIQIEKSKVKARRGRHLDPRGARAS